MTFTAIRRVILSLASVALVAGGLASGASAQSQPDPVTCEGYPEKRVYLENQSWVEPQTGPTSHPGTGQQGHIHVGTCFPLHQEVTGDVLSLDIRFQLHNVPGDVGPLRVGTYAPGTGNSLINNVPSGGNCSEVDCDRWVHADFPLSDVASSGWVEFQIYPIVFSVDETGDRTGQKWYNVPRWYLNIQNGAPAGDAPNQIRIGGDTWLTSSGQDGGNYSEAQIATEDLPWDFTTGEMITVSGTWAPDVNFDHTPAPGFGLALIDPHLHASPPDMGTVVYDGPGGDVALSIDTTQLSNGLHRLLLRSCNPNITGGFTNCGVLVVPFLVDNGPPPVVVDLEPGQSAVINCSTTLTGTIGENEANLACGG